MSEGALATEESHGIFTDCRVRSPNAPIGLIGDQALQKKLTIFKYLWLTFINAEVLVFGEAITH